MCVVETSQWGCMKAVDDSKPAVMFHMVDKVMATEADVTRIMHTSLCVRLGVGTALETSELLVRRHLTSWNNRSASIIRTLDGLVTTVCVEVAVQLTARAFPLALVVYTHDV